MSFLNRFMESLPCDDLLQSVVRNLDYLLNSRPGYGSRLRDYGLGAYLAQQSNKGAQLTILRELQQDILTLEPRLQVHSLVAHGRDAELRLRVRLRGELLARGGPRPCELLILVHLPSGAVTVRGEASGGGSHAA